MKNGVLIVLLFCLCLAIRSDAVAHMTGRMEKLPRMALWAWERPTDLRGLDTQKYAVAYLDQTLTIGSNVQSQPRRDPIIYPSSAKLIPVVRIETAANAVLDETVRDQAVRDILRSVGQQHISALQVDFDATLSQRGFYRDLLVNLRRQMPANLPLSITALASWCSYDDWLHGLPVDEAVPMYFRMEPDRHRAPASLSEYRIREPFCESSVGVSTVEAWPPDTEGKRIYIFPEVSGGKKLRRSAPIVEKLP